MAGQHLTVLSSADFPQVPKNDIDRPVDRVLSQIHLGQRWYEDEHSDRRQPVTVHPLDPKLIDYEYCLQHFEKVTHV